MRGSRCSVPAQRHPASWLNHSCFDLFPARRHGAGDRGIERRRERGRFVIERRARNRPATPGGLAKPAERVLQRHVQPELILGGGLPVEVAVADLSERIRRYGRLVERLPSRANRGYRLSETGIEPIGSAPGIGPQPGLRFSLSLVCRPVSFGLGIGCFALRRVSDTTGLLGRGAGIGNGCWCHDVPSRVISRCAALARW